LVLEPDLVEAVLGKRVLVAAAVALGLGDGQPDATVRITAGNSVQGDLGFTAR